jgi:hypothetical protein
MVKVKPGAKVITIEPAQNASTIGWVVRLLSAAFEQICALKEVDKLVLERFRIIFHAAKDYGPLLAHYEKWEKIEGQIEELAAAVTELTSSEGHCCSGGCAFLEMVCLFLQLFCWLYALSMLCMMRRELGMMRLGCLGMMGSRPFVEECCEF